MPKATVDPELHHFDLQTLPGGYVKLRTLSFHEMELRKDIAGRMYQEEKVSRARQGGRKTNEDEMLRAYFESMNVKVTEFEFRSCVIEHNLFIDDAETQLIDFTKPMHSWKLNPKIGEEISKYIAELTQIDEDDVGPLPTALSSSSPTTETGTEPSTPNLSTVEN
jgi:hypothetical protein